MVKTEKKHIKILVIYKIKSVLCNEQQYKLFGEKSDYRKHMP